MGLSPATQKQRDFLATLALAQGAPVGKVLALYGQSKPEATNALSRLTDGGALLDPLTGRLGGRARAWNEAAAAAAAVQEEERSGTGSSSSTGETGKGKGAGSSTSPEELSKGKGGKSWKKK